MRLPRDSKSIRRLYAARSNVAPLNLVTIMQDVLYLIVIVVFSVLTFGLGAGCAALGARK